MAGGISTEVEDKLLKSSIDLMNQTPTLQREEASDDDIIMLDTWTAHISESGSYLVINKNTDPSATLLHFQRIQLLTFNLFLERPIMCPLEPQNVAFLPEARSTPGITTGDFLLGWFTENVLEDLLSTLASLTP